MMEVTTKTAVTEMIVKMHNSQIYSYFGVNDFVIFVLLFIFNVRRWYLCTYSIYMKTIMYIGYSYVVIAYPTN